MNGQDPAARIKARKARSASPIEDLERWLRAKRALLSKHARVAKAIDYLLSSDPWPGFTGFLSDGRVCLSNSEHVNATGPNEHANAERTLRGVALGRKSWLFAGAKRAGHRATFMYSLSGTARLDGIDPFDRLTRRHWRHGPILPWLADAIARISDLPVSRLPELLPWTWCNPAHLRIAA